MVIDNSAANTLQNNLIVFEIPWGPKSTLAIDIATSNTTRINCTHTIHMYIYENPPVYVTNTLFVTFNVESTKAIRYENSTVSPTIACLSGVENKGTASTPGGDATKEN